MWETRVLDGLGFRPYQAGVFQDCFDPEEFVVDSALAGVPPADIEPWVDIMSVEYNRDFDSPLLAPGYPCNAGGEDEGRLSLCSGEVDGELFHVVSYETDEPIPLAHPEYHFELRFDFDSDGDAGNDIVPTDALPNDYRTGTDTAIVAQYRPDSGWSLSRKLVSEAGQRVANARFIVDGPVVALVVQASDFASNKPRGRISIVRHTGDLGRAPPHDWSGFLFPPNSEDPF